MNAANRLQLFHIVLNMASRSHENAFQEKQQSIDENENGWHQSKLDVSPAGNMLGCMEQWLPHNDPWSHFPELQLSKW